MLPFDSFLRRFFFPEIFRIEWIVLAAALTLFILLPHRSGWLRSAKGVLDSIVSRRWLSILIPIGTVLLGRALLLPVLGIPAPSGADEFGYLLTAQTFCLGRLTNPTSPVWPSFEATNVFHVPSYQSHFPIAYPLLLAATQKLFGRPWLAVYLVTALLAGCITWMLHAWVPPKWALLGGMFVAFRIGLFSFWMNSYWGGSLVALGACLLLGAVPRIRPQEGRRNAGRPRYLPLYLLMAALGLVVLTNTRPFDGGVFALVVLLWMAFAIVSDRATLRQVTLLKVLPALMLFLAAEAFVAYYQFRVTGSVWRLPYTITAQQYGVAPPFLFQKLKAIPHYNHWEFYHFHVLYEPGIYREQIAGLRYSHIFYVRTLLFRANLYGHFYIGPLMVLPLLFALPTVFSKKLRLPWIVLGGEMLATLLESFVQVNYIAPLTGVIVLLLISGARRLAVFCLGSFPAGRRAIRALPAVCLIMLVVRLGSFSDKSYQLTEARSLPPDLTWAFSSYRNYHREALEKWLNTVPGTHLVIVHVQPRHWNYLEDKVYNGADLQNAPILWARNMGTADNCRLAEHYPRRSYWLIDDWSADLEDWRADLRPRRVTAEELCTFGWERDSVTKDEVWRPVARPLSPSASLVNARHLEHTP